MKYILEILSGISVLFILGTLFVGMFEWITFWVSLEMMIVIMILATTKGLYVGWKKWKQRKETRQ